MSHLLPIQPNLEHLKNEAKSLLKAHDAGDPSACPVLRKLRRFASADDAAVLAAAVTLTETQFALAQDYEFKSWDELRKVVLRTRPLAGAQEAPQAHAMRLPDPPAGKSGNQFARAYHMAMAYCGVACDYDTVAGDSGLAFILQADNKHTPYGAAVRELDLGWWPLAEWGAKLRLDFLGRAHGIALRRLPLVEEEFRADAAGHYRTHHRAAVIECLQTGRPVVAGEESGIWVVTGMDEGTPPLLGQISCSDVAAVKRLSQYPWNVIALGEMSEPLDHARVDAEAIAFACHLHNDRLGEAVSGCPVELDGGKSSGKASFALWAEALRDGRCGPSHYSANVVGCTIRNRRSAPPYLRQMASRHGQAAAGRLRAAADVYDEILKKLATANTGKEAFGDAARREKLAGLVDDVAALEAKAVGQLARIFHTK